MVERPSRATLTTIAAAAGVSRQTVSNVVNAPERVTPATRRRVEKVIEQAGYRPSAAAQMLRGRRAGAVALRMPSPGDGISGALFDTFVHSLVLAARQRSARITLFAADDPADEVATLVDLVHRGLADGCVLTDTVTDDRDLRS